MEPENKDIINSLKQAQELRSKSPPVPTVPSTIGNYPIDLTRNDTGQFKKNNTNYKIHLFIFIFSPGKEKLINPFMRVAQKSVRDHSGNTTSNVETMKFIRTEKDNFKPT